ncbi:MAG: murein hydrolase activator EnvC family protein [Acidimicrobiia bacterium]
MTTKILARCLLVLCCLMAATSPTPAGGEEFDASALATLKREGNEAAARWSKARSDQLRINKEVTGLELRVSDLEGRMDLLRRAAARGTATMYKRDSVVDSVSGFGDTAAILGSARRTKLIGQINDLAGEAVLRLGEAAEQLKTKRQALDVRRRQQDEVVAQLNGERRAVESQLKVMAKAEKELRTRELAAAKALARTSRAKPPAIVRARPGPGGSFICPINGPVAFSNDFGDGRNHKGNDLMNPRGTENVAVVAGAISSRRWGAGGLTLFLTGDDGHTYVYMHLQEIVGPQPRHVEQGEVIGLTGRTGNATAYHTHFEFHPGHGGAVNPHPLIAAHC